MCPWPRIQGAMLDRGDSLLVTYSGWRGEPRGPHKKAAELGGRAATASTATACVAVCPTGIDIRDGPQLECIQCALCIDACDDDHGQGRPTARADRLRHRSRKQAAAAKARAAPTAGSCAPRTHALCRR